MEVNHSVGLVYLADLAILEVVRFPEVVELLQEYSCWSCFSLGSD